jgi:mono/diheme cytochrome c family protein
MRYFLLIWFLLCVAVVSIAGFRGTTFRKPPIEIFPDMDRQPKLRPQTRFSFFEDDRSSRLPVAGTIAHVKPEKVGEAEVYPFEENAVNTGHVPGNTNYVATNPYPITEQLMARGQERFQINCSPCHGSQGDGTGITKRIGAMAIVANLHDARIVQQTDGEIFNTITHGKNLMGAYGPTVAVPDRWAIIAYLRALQRSRLGSVEDLPADMISMLPNAKSASGNQPASAK